MKLFVSKEKFAGLKGYENVRDFEESVAANRKRNLTTDSNVKEAFELIKKHSR